ncbi:hypothetical protein MSWAN_1653 [Methanobacterium paludis]|uniref:Uncharacterized protein n=1 Tax=Methanobacterium paludis (strain DSM 25820 / JCM 18151 / SWAN1) TaxID=868131 RepID=F6D2T5_METPW|nr:hypothetical protein MSWAN_1653 [Methanobacterium paludis]
MKKATKEEIKAEMDSWDECYTIIIDYSEFGRDEKGNYR